MMSDLERAKRPSRALILGIVCVQGCISLWLTSPGVPPWDRPALSALLIPLLVVTVAAAMLWGLWISVFQKAKIGIVLISSTIALNPYSVCYLRALAAGIPRKGVSGEINRENWQEHEKILDIRRVYEKIRTDRESGRLVKKTDELECGVNQIQTRETRAAFRDGNGPLRLYVTEQKDVHDGERYRHKKIERYYDSQGVLRDAYLEFSHGRSQYGRTDTRQVIFFDRAGNAVWSWLDEFGADDRPVRRFGMGLIEPWMRSLGTAEEMQRMFESHSFACVPIGPPIQDTRY